ncbi:Cytochrome P450 monooxygenase yanH [Colletotrichum siamense]|nr:Cytochrome P450 monooxygenase yanH [Colletotrichum siamense]
MALLAVTLLGLLVLVALTIVKTFTKLRTSSLSHLPNAGWGANYSRLLWVFWQEYRGNVTLKLPELHEQLGPLVQIGPNEVSFYSMEIYDAVHKLNSGFVKDPRNYGEFVQDGHPALFSITHPEEHAKRRRILGQLYSRSKIGHLEELMLKHVDHFVATIRQKFGAFDIGPACRALEADIISEFSFGEALHAIAAWSKEEELAIVSKNDHKATLMPLLMNFPTLYELWISIEDIVCRATGSRVSYKQGLAQYDQWTHDAWTRNKLAEKPTSSEFPNLIRVMVAAGVPSQTALSEAKENLGPGTDTTSASLAHTLYALSKNQVFQQALYEDLARVGFPTDLTALENIPRLKACVKEGVRWAGAAAAMLPRVAPKGGVELLGKFIPEGTVLTSSPIWYLRDKSAFPDPELFDPYRWVNESGMTIKEDAFRDKFYVPFSKGPNICIGLHFSYYELYLSLAKIIQSFELVALDESSSHSYGHGWIPVELPKRREWVAAVPTDPLLVKVLPRRQVG